MDNITAEVGVKVGWIAKDLKESTDALLSFVLGFFLEVNGLVALVKVREDAVYELQKLERSLIVEFHHGKVLHKGRTVKAVNDLLYFIRVKVRGFAKNLSLVLVAVALVICVKV